MATRTFLSLVQRLVTSVPGCPQPVIEQYVRDAAIDACERTLAWRYEQPLIRLTPGVYDYPYEQPTGSEVHAVITSSVNGYPIDPMTVEQIHSRYPDWPNYDVSRRATPRFLVHLDDDTFGVAPLPDDSEPYDLKMMVALKPLRTATGMDQTAMDDLENVIMHGALRDLLILPNKNWSDRELASYHAKQYISKTAERRARTMLGAGRASVSVQMRPLA
jgi:hypothetical protein